MSYSTQGASNRQIYDCCDYLNAKEGKPKGSWMIDWLKRLKEEKPYESEFVKWSKRFKVLIPFLLVISCNH